MFLKSKINFNQEKATENTPKKILCVEDHDDTCELYEVIFSEYDFTFASGVAEALTLFKENDFDLCLMDGRLCDGSGASLCRQMLELKPDFPVVFVSGLTRDRDIEEAKIAGAKEYLVKPCDTEKLQKIVKELIGD